MTAPAAKPPRKRRLPPLRTWLLPAAIVFFVLAGLAFVGSAVVFRPSAPPAAASTPVPAPVATPAPSESPSTGDGGRSARSQEYRTYATTVMTNGTTLVWSLGSLAGCRMSREECLTRIDQALTEVNDFQRALNRASPPPCLSTADRYLRDGLTFQQRGLQQASVAVARADRLRTVQGLVLITAGLTRQGQAVAQGRQATC